jgi:monoamine oxidase
MRLAGGTAAAVRALARELSPDSILLRTKVKGMMLVSAGVRLTVENASGEQDIIDAGHVIAALPPRLIEATITFSPAQEGATAGRWRDTPTWMAPHAKFFAIYDRPFWRAAGLSGTAQSIAGPMAEIHDATTASGRAALFGFIGVGAEQRAAVSEETLKIACLVQLERLFGPAARSPVATLLKDWAVDPLTATSTDLVAAGHPVVRDDAWVTGGWDGRLSLAGSETSPTEPGYLSGAVTAAQRAVSQYLSKQGAR